MENNTNLYNQIMESMIDQTYYSNIAQIPSHCTPLFQCQTKWLPLSNKNYQSVFVFFSLNNHYSFFRLKIKLIFVKQNLL